MKIWSMLPAFMKAPGRPIKRAIKEYLFLREADWIMENRNLPEHSRHLVFLAAYPQMWNTLKPIYDAAVRRKIKTTILALPRFHVQSGFDSVNEMARFLNRRGIPCVSAYNPNDGTWMELESLKPSHVLYMRPYLHEYPQGYQPNKVALYARTCLIPYGDVETITSPHYEIVFNRDFVVKTNMVLPCSDEVCGQLVKDFSKYIEKGSLAIKPMPDPRLHEVVKALRIPAVPDGEFTILYTPRWAVRNNPNLTSFFDYFEKLVSFTQKQNGVRLLFRPHPLAFDAFVREGKMTQDDVLRLKEYMDQEDGLEYDTNEDYVPSFLKADVMLTDYSALVLEFFQSGKPILYTDDPAKITGRFEEEFSAMYDVETWDDVESCLKMLLAGEDPMRSRRERALLNFDRYGNAGEIALDAMGV